MNDNTEIHVSKYGCVSFTGDAVELFRLTVILKGLQLFNRTGIVLTAHAKPRHMLNLAGTVTKKKYSNSVKGRDTAIADLEEYCSLLKSGIPITRE